MGHEQREHWEPMWGAVGGSPGPAGSDMGQLPGSPAPLLTTWSVVTGWQGQPVHRGCCALSAAFFDSHAWCISYDPLLGGLD